MNKSELIRNPKAKRNPPAHIFAIAKELGLIRPDDATPHLWREFLKAFGEGCALWTSEDGFCVAVAILRRPNWEETLQFEFSHYFDRQPFDPKRATQQFADREYFEDYCGGSSRGRWLWAVNPEPSPFPVMHYEFETPF